MANYPIWRDLAYSVTGRGTYIPYTLKLNGVEIFNGRAYPLPNESDVTIFINRLVKDFLSGRIDLSRDVVRYTQTNWARTFELYSGSALLGTYSMYADWSYSDDIEDGVRNLLGAPIQDYVDRRQLFFTSVANLGGANSTLGVTASHGAGSYALASATITPSSAVTAAPSLRVLNSMYKEVRVMAGTQTLRTVKIVDSCARYCLYYLNAYGGYDTLLIHGNTLRTDKFSRTQIAREANNSGSLLEFGRSYVSTTINRAWRLYTDYLSDEQWARTPHLLGSTQVFLHDLETDDIVPVVITNNSAEYRTYANQGNKKSYLTIDVEASLSQTRY